MSDEERKAELEEHLKAINKKLEEQDILISIHASTQKQKENHAAFSLTIPNELYILWEKKIALQKNLGRVGDTLTGMLNDMIKSQLNIKSLSTVEERMQRKSMRYLWMCY